MPTREDIEIQDDASLDSLDRELVRQVLNINGKPDSAIYIESEIRMNALTSSQNQIVRALLVEYSDAAFDTTHVAGGPKGAYLDPRMDVASIANELRRMLYPGLANEIPEQSISVPLGTFTFIGTTYSTGTEGERS